MCAVDMAERFYTIDELAQLFRVSRNTIKKDIDSGELQAVQIRSQYRISESALQAYTQRRTTSSNPGRKEEPVE